MKKKIFSLFMIFTLCFCQVNNVYADAGSLVVAGGSIAVGGLGGAALAGLAGPVVVAVFVGMMAMGFDVELTKASQQAGMTKTQFVKSKIEQYCNEANLTFGAFSDYILTETTVLRDGTIKLGDQASAQIKKFCNWLFNSNQVSEAGQSNPDGSITLGDLNLPYGKTWSYVNGAGQTVTYTSDVDMAWCCTPNLGYYTTVGICLDGDNNNISFVCSVNGTAYGSASYVVINGYRRYVVAAVSNTAQMIGLPNVENLYTFLNGLDGTLTPDTETSSDGFTGSRDTWNDRSGVLDPTQGRSTVINPGLIGQINIPSDKDLSIDVGEYLDAIQKVIDKLGEIEIPTVDDNDGIPITIEIPDTAVIDPTIDKEDDQDLPQEEDQTPVIDDNPVDPEKDPELAQAPLKFDIKGIFPFCIPFDIKNMLSKLSSDPVAPVYTVNWHIPIINQNLNFTVDLTPFNDVAAVARKMELLGLVIGLAIITRSMLIRG